jgi:hypothetical protein
VTCALIIAKIGLPFEFAVPGAFFLALEMTQGALREKAVWCGISLNSTWSDGFPPHGCTSENHVYYKI